MALNSKILKAIEMNSLLAENLRKEFISRTKRYKGKIKAYENCRVWTGSVFHARGNYGAATFRKYGIKTMRAHRLSYILFRKNITSEDHVLHKCDNPLCVYPKHLFLGDQTSNMTDKVSKNRQDKGETHGMHKLKEIEAIRIIKDSRKYYEIAADYGVSSCTVSDIKCGRSWKHLARKSFGRYKTDKSMQAAR